MYDIQLENEINITNDTVQTVTLSSLPRGATFRFPNATREHLKLFTDTKGNTVCLSLETEREFIEERKHCKVVPIGEFQVSLKLSRIS